jgi:hypothetical protein
MNLLLQQILNIVQLHLDIAWMLNELLALRENGPQTHVYVA